MSEQLPSDSDHRMERIWSDYESVEPYLLLSSEEDTSLEETIRDPVSIEYATSNAGIMGKPFQVSFEFISLTRLEAEGDFRMSCPLSLIYQTAKVKF